MAAHTLLTRASTLWCLGIATVLLSLSFAPAAAQFDLVLLDGISSPAIARETLASFSTEQRVAHAWITATMDVVYPLVYGPLFAGVTLLFFPKRRWLALPGLLVIPVDLFEGLVQVLALLEVSDWLGAKALVTPLKLLLFACGLITALAAWLQWLYHRVTSS